jgi:phenylalanyl-tRNA synthetase beta chain
MMAARDYQEVVNYSFVGSRLDALLGGEPPIALLNPIAAQMDVMRTTLWGGLVETLRANLNRKASRVRLFEVGRVFHADAAVAPGELTVKGVRQPTMLGALAYGPALEEQWGTRNRGVDFFDVKADLLALAGTRPLQFVAATHPALHPGRSARVERDRALVGWIGEMHPAVQAELELAHAPVLVEVQLDALLERLIPVFREVSRFPPVVRDLALVLDAAVPAQKLLDATWSALAQHALGAVVKNVRIFDEYRGKGLENKEKSLAIRLWMQDTQRTLNETEVNELIADLVAKLGSSMGVRLRAGA